MKKIIGIKIEETEHELGIMTRISGRNGAGKTTIARALLWGLTGLTPALVPEPEAFGTVEIIFDNNDIVERKMGVVKFNGAKITQNDLNKMLKIHNKTLGIMLWPGLFFQLSQQQRRDLFLSITPNIPLEHFALLHYSKEQLADIDFAMLSLKGNKIYEYYLEQKRETEKAMATIGGQLHEIDNQIHLQIKAKQEQYQKQLEAYQQSKAQAEKQIPVVDTKQLDDLRKEREAALKLVREIGAKLDGVKRLFHEAEQQSKRSDSCPTCGRKFEKIEEYHARCAIKVKTIGEEMQELNTKYNNACAYEVSVRQELQELERLAEQAKPAKLAPEPEALEPAIEQIKSSNEKRKANLDGRLAELKAQLEKTIRAAALVHPKSGLPAEILKEKVGRLELPGFSFSFSETQKNGEEIDSFNLVRTADSLPVDCLSSGEKIKFCLALSRLIADLTGSEIRFVFLEQADLIDSIPRLPAFQMAAEKVNKNDLTLEILL